MDFLQKVHYLDGFSFEEKRKEVHRYVSLEKFACDVKDGKLTFVSPTKWSDKFEQLYFTAKNFKKYGFKKNEYDVFCICVTRNSTCNEEAFWKPEKDLRISFNLDALLSQLDAFCKKNDCDIYLGEADYSFSRSNILSLHKENNKDAENNENHAKFFPKNFTIENFLKLMCLKRQSFKFEDEIRMFLVKKSNGKNECHFAANVDYNSDLVKRITISPHSKTTKKYVQNLCKSFNEVYNSSLERDLKLPITL